MNRDTGAIVRAHLKAAAIAAIMVQVVALFCIGIVGTNEATFESLWFRLLAVALIVSFVCLMRLACYLAYVEMLATSSGLADCDVSAAYRESSKMKRWLIDMHRCFTGKSVGAGPTSVNSPAELPAQLNQDRQPNPPLHRKDVFPPATDSKKYRC